jgi:hypothetical protein
MSKQRNEIKERVRHEIELQLDSFLAGFGFSRRKKSMFYSRKLPGGFQKIEFAIESRPLDNRNAAGVIYPFLEVGIDTVEKQLAEMLGDELSLLIPQPGVTLRQPIATTSAKAERGRWFLYQPDSVPSAVAQVKEFLQKWTLPFLDEHTSVADICTAYDRDDQRIEHEHRLRVVSAMLLIGRTADAIEVAEYRFGKAGSRKRHQRVFDYLATRS